MTDQAHWHASRIEQQIAWAVATCSMVIIILTASQPQWFEFSQSESSTISVSSTVITAPSTTAKTISKATPPQRIGKPNPSPKLAQQTHRKESTVKISPTHNTAPLKPNANSAAFYVQLGAFKERARAQSLVHKIKKKGWSVKSHARKGGLHAVWIGPKSTREKAAKLLKSIQQKLNYKGFIVQDKT